jgi:UDP-2,3-diacylglucosamine pyrophosphatase LpxH
MKVLMMSDFHLGSPLFNSKDRIISLLNKEHYDRIFLIGDLIDTWEDAVDDIVVANSEIINEINKFDNITIIRGNHDPSKEDLKNIFYSCDVFDSCELYMDDKKALITHGYEFDDMVMKYSWAAKTVYPIHWISERFNMNLKGRVRELYCSVASKRNEPYYKDLVLSMEKALVDRYGSRYDYIIVGHTHLPKITGMEGCLYINCGDWIHNKTCVLYKNGMFTLVR